MRKSIFTTTLITLLVFLFAGCSDVENPTQLITDESSEQMATFGYAIPDNAVLVSADLYLFAENYSNADVTAHLVTSDWEEMVVTWDSFGEAYLPTSFGGFHVVGNDWNTMDLTAQMSDWMSGDLDNFGILLKQADPTLARTKYFSFEAASLQPYLEVVYQLDGATITEQLSPLADTFITELYPTSNWGGESGLYTATRLEDDGSLVEKQTLIRFDLDVVPPGQQEGCSRTIGYWKTHSGHGPQDDDVTPLLPITLGDYGGENSQAVTDADIAYDVLRQKTYGRPNNGITKLYAQLLGTKLNLANGADDEDVTDAIVEADAFLADHDWTDWRFLSDDDKDQVLIWKDHFDAYNNGDIGPGHCE